MDPSPPPEVLPPTALRAGDGDTVGASTGAADRVDVGATLDECGAAVVGLPDWFGGIVVGAADIEGVAVPPTVCGAGFGLIGLVVGVADRMGGAVVGLPDRLGGIVVGAVDTEGVAVPRKGAAMVGLHELGDVAVGAAGMKGANVGATVVGLHIAVGAADIVGAYEPSGDGAAVGLRDAVGDLVIGAAATLGATVVLLVGTGVGWADTGGPVYSVPQMVNAE